MDHGLWKDCSLGRLDKIKFKMITSYSEPLNYCDWVNKSTSHVMAMSYKITPIGESTGEFQTLNFLFVPYPILEE